MLRILNLEAGYGSLRVLKGISLHVGAGEAVAIIGANGAGKTTLLKTVAGILRPQRGTIEFDKRPIHATAAERIVKMGCCLVPEGRHVFGSMTVRENLLLGAYCHGKRGILPRSEGSEDRRFPEAQQDTRQDLPAGRQVPASTLATPDADALLQQAYDMFGILKERQAQLAGTLSGGQQQMLAIARGLMSAPRLLMLDEPSLGVAPLVVKSIYQTIAALKQAGLTILLVEQNARAALAVANRGYVVETGQIVMEGSCQELRGNRDVQRAYLGKDYRTIDEAENGRR
jgi:branched-chain amino acid transport system ATP-binding protein